jgi:hypothetical protein
MGMKKVWLVLGGAVFFLLAGEGNGQETLIREDFNGEVSGGPPSQAVVTLGPGSEVRVVDAFTSPMDPFGEEGNKSLFLAMPTASGFTDVRFEAPKGGVVLERGTASLKFFPEVNSRTFVRLGSGSGTTGYAVQLQFGTGGRVFVSDGTIVGDRAKPDWRGNQVNTLEVIFDNEAKTFSLVLNDEPVTVTKDGRIHEEFAYVGEAAEVGYLNLRIGNVVGGGNVYYDDLLIEGGSREIDWTAGPVLFRGQGAGGRGLMALPDGRWLNVRVRNIGGALSLAERYSGNYGLSWSEDQKVLELPEVEGYFGTMTAGALDAKGEVQYALVHVNGSGNQRGVDYFFDLWQTRSTEGRANWEAPKEVFRGFTPALQPFAISSHQDKLILPFHYVDPGLSRAPPTGDSITTALWSDDGGATWQRSNSELRTPVGETYNGSMDGAVEPVAIYQPTAERFWMIIRTQDHRLYQSFSYDEGRTWSDAEPSRFSSSHSPAYPLRLDDGRLLLLWNNTRIVPRHQGQGVYSGRDVLHAAISENDGQTWRGFRELVRDPVRHESPQQTGDRGVAYPHALPMDEGRVAVMTGQGATGRHLIWFDPVWLYETSSFSDFSDGLEQWSAFTEFGPASGWWRDRHLGPEVVDHPDEPGAKVLHLNNPEAQDGDGAVWNFPLGTRGEVAVRLRLTEGSQAAHIALNDRFFNPTDDAGEEGAVVAVRIDANRTIVGTGTTLEADQWYTLAIRWDLWEERATLLVDEVAVAELPILNPTENGISYLRLRAPDVVVPDPDGFYVDWARAEIFDSNTLVAEGDLRPIEAWRLRYFGTTLAIGDAANDADPDGDGWPNLGEYFLGRNPLHPDSAPGPLLSLVEVGDETFLSLQFSRLASAVDVDYILEVSNDLIEWEAAGEVLVTEIGPPDGTGMETLRLRDQVPLAGENRRFLRLRFVER